MAEMKLSVHQAFGGIFLSLKSPNFEYHNHVLLQTLSSFFFVHDSNNGCVDLSTHDPLHSLAWAEVVAQSHLEIRQITKLRIAE